MENNEHKIVNFDGKVEDFLEKKIYRYIGFKQLKEMIANSKNTLSSPVSWNQFDPYENVFFSIPLRSGSSGETIHLSKLSEHFYAQCWSLRVESDAMWRIYGDRYRSEGAVKIQTTVRKLMDSHPEKHFKYAGQVRYHSKERLIRQWRDFTHNLVSHLATDGGTGKILAEQLLVKRSPYFHEKEMRFLVADHDVKGRSPIPSQRQYTIRPNELIEKVVFDPRMKTKRYQSLKDELRSIGFKNPVIRSRLYKLKVGDFK